MTKGILVIVCTILIAVASWFVGFTDGRMSERGFKQIDWNCICEKPKQKPKIPKHWRSA